MMEPNETEEDPVGYGVKVKNPFDSLNDFADLDENEVLQRLEAQKIQDAKDKAKAAKKTDKGRSIDRFESVTLEKTGKLQKGTQKSPENLDAIKNQSRGGFSSSRGSSATQNARGRGGLVAPRFSLQHSNLENKHENNHGIVATDHSPKKENEVTVGQIRTDNHLDPKAQFENQKVKNNDSSTDLPEDEVVLEEPKQMTLDEYKASMARRDKPKFNERKAGEGETKRKEKLVPLTRRNPTDIKEQEEEEFVVMYKQPKKQVVKLDWKFSDRAVRGRGRVGSSRDDELTDSTGNRTRNMGDIRLADPSIEDFPDLTK